MKKNIVLGSREVFAPRGVVFVDVQSGGNYRIRNLRIVPSINGELVYLPTDWSLLFEGNDMGDIGGENIHQLVAKVCWGENVFITFLIDVIGALELGKISSVRTKIIRILVRCLDLVNFRFKLQIICHKIY